MENRDDRAEVERWDTSGRRGTFEPVYPLGRAAVDPAGPKLDVVGDADPWVDLWFYTNPIWVLPK
ncbi:hypothetical protein [Kribbella kalugense]|uniref:hypothetical protein n=1 Tax=Kribbella kalugense TaxID=2512221 RepID=UPI0010663B76|nr:hypothetical protein [Kribbella kalugense]